MSCLMNCRATLAHGLRPPPGYLLSYLAVLHCLARALAAYCLRESYADADADASADADADADASAGLRP